jgi:citrate lyase beta subunit
MTHWLFLVRIESLSMPPIRHDVPEIAESAVDAIAKATVRYRADESIKASVKERIAVAEVRRLRQWAITEAPPDASEDDL